MSVSQRHASALCPRGSAPCPPPVPKCCTPAPHCTPAMAPPPGDASAWAPSACPCCFLHPQFAASCGSSQPSCSLPCTPASPRAPLFSLLLVALTAVAPAPCCWSCLSLWFLSSLLSPPRCAEQDPTLTAHLHGPQGLLPKCPSR